MADRRLTDRLAFVTGTTLATKGGVGAGLMPGAIFVVLRATAVAPEVEQEATSPH